MLHSLPYVIPNVTIILTLNPRDQYLSWSACCGQRRVQCPSWTTLQCSTVKEGKLKRHPGTDRMSTCISSLCRVSLVEILHRILIGS